MHRIFSKTKYKTGMSEVGAILRAQNAQSSKNVLRFFFNEKLKEVSKHPKGGFRAQKMLEKFGYGVLD